MGKKKEKILDSETLKEVSEVMIDKFKDVGESMSKIGRKCGPDLERDKCTHCGEFNIGGEYTGYCERCYQELIAKNAQLELKLKNSIDKNRVMYLMSDLNHVLSKRESEKYTETKKLKEIMEIYLFHLDILGGVNDESHDMSTNE